MLFFKKYKKIEVHERREMEIRIKLINEDGQLRKEVSVDDKEPEAVTGFSIECPSTDAIPIIKLEQWI